MQIDLNTLYSREDAFIKSLHRPKPYKQGRSIVTTCYDREIPGTWVLLSELRRLHCGLPIEVFHRAGELSDDQIALLESAIPGQVTVKEIKGNAKDFVSRYGHTHGWSCKIYALTESEHDENLWIDGDNYPTRNPEFLFDDPEYLAKGSLFWRDMFSPDSANQYADGSPMWPIFNVPINDAEPFEAGQLLINKSKRWAELALVRYYADNCEIYYHFGGDKETFKFAWQRMGMLGNVHPMRINYHSDPNVPFGFMPYGPFSKGDPNQYHKWGGGTVMVQRDREGRELFNHRNMQKLRLGSNPVYHDITNEKHYHSHIEALAKRMGA